MNVTFYGRSRGTSEEKYVKECLSSGLETDGFFMKKLIKNWNTFFPGPSPLFTTSCTTALEMAVACLGLTPGDQVIIPSYNFPSAANAVLLHGGVPVFCDIDGETQNISVSDMQSRIGPRTRAVIAVHYAGVSCPMKELLSAAKEADLALIEDAAQGIGAGYLGEDGIEALGTMGDLGALSFHHTKNLTCGEGGVMITSHKTYYSQAVQYRLHGTNRAMYLRGEADRYTWNMPGSCTAMGELAAAVLVSQVEILHEVTQRRRAILNGYLKQLSPLEEKGAARLMGIPAYAEPNGHIFYLRFESEAQREEVRKRLTSEGIECKSHYVPLHLSPQGQKLGYGQGGLKESAQCHKTILRLPIHGEMTGEEMEWVSDRTLKACGMQGL